MYLFVFVVAAFSFISFLSIQGSADSNYSQPSSDLSLDEEKESLRREKERQALGQLEKARVSFSYYIYHLMTFPFLDFIRCFSFSLLLFCIESISREKAD